MRVDAQRIRLERERRAWTQAQLAGATGLGLRTVQRIEHEGSASFESVQAIAAALELSIADLRIETVPEAIPTANPEPSLSTPSFSFLRILFAALSGVAVAYLVESRNGDLVLYRGPFWASALDYLVAGCLFAAAVLIPELPAGRAVVRRATGLVLASALSLFAAVVIAVEGPEWLGTLSGSSTSAFATASGEPTIYTLIFASIVGASIVLAAARLLIGVDRPLGLWITGMIAAVLGGVMFDAGMIAAVLEGVRFNRGYAFFFPVPFASFAIWHMLLCVAIQVGRGREMTLPSVRPLTRAARAVLRGGRFWRQRAPQT